MTDKHFCRNCKCSTNHKELFKERILNSDEYEFFKWFDEFCVIQCLGCETLSFLKIYGDTDMVREDDFGNQDYYYDNTIYPPYLKKGIELEYQYYLPESIKNIYKETISAFKNNLFLLTAGGMRAILEALCNHLKIKNDNLSNRIDLLHKNGHLTLSESKRLHSIRFLGNDALHEIATPKEEHLYILLEIINHLLANLFINDKIVKGNVDSLVDNYEDFIKLIKNRINVSMLGKHTTLLQILDKSKRLIPTKPKLIEYEKELIKDIDASKYSFIKIITKKPEAIFEISEVPSEFMYSFK